MMQLRARASIFGSAVCNQFCDGIPFGRIAQTSPKQAPRQFPSIGNDPHKDFIFALHRLPVKTIARLTWRLHLRSVH